MRREKPPEQIPELGMRLVYRGHFHTVYCDGIRHLRLTGNGTASWTVDLVRVRDVFKCDCEKYRRETGL